MNESVSVDQNDGLLLAAPVLADDHADRNAEPKCAGRTRCKAFETTGTASITKVEIPPSLERLLVDQLAMVYALSCAGVITRVNAKLCAVTGYSADQLIGSSYEDLCPDLINGEVWRDLQQLAATNPDTSWSGESRIRTKEGSELYLSNTIMPQYDAGGKLTGYCCAGVDITETVKLRQALDQNSKLMQLGQLTATVAHEIRNPLGAIRTAVFMLERKLKGNADGIEVQLERINGGIRRCDKIITELLDFSRKKTPNLHRLDVDTWLADVLQDECRSIPHGTNVRVSPSPAAIVARFDPDQIRQVMINLINNAGEAMAEKIAASTAGADYVPQLTISTRLNGDMVEIAVADNGPGIDEKNLARIREPLFTTKSFGVGLGLPAIEKILQNHGGGLDIQSTVGQGATMTARIRVNLP